MLTVPKVQSVHSGVDAAELNKLWHIYCQADLSAEQASYENQVINHQVDERYNDYKQELERVMQLGVLG